MFASRTETQGAGGCCSRRWPPRAAGRRAGGDQGTTDILDPERGARIFDSLVGGNYFVGLVIFAILIVINFMVITKGAGRVAEVGARFTLDAMPGKQMAIDAELNAGLIDKEEAKRRRTKIERESDFYGAMDGASKFVKERCHCSHHYYLINIVVGLLIN